MNILDAIILIVLLVGVLGGIRRGFVKEVVLLIGLFIVIIASYYLKNPVATFFYKHLPFFKFGGIFKGVSVINILVYEVIAFLIVFSVLYLVLRILLKISGLIESLLKATIILGFFSKIAGAIVGFIESYIIVFILLFIASQPFIRVTGIEESWLANTILDKTPIMSGSVKNTRDVVNEIYTLSKSYKNDSKRFNEESIRLFIKYDIISEENIEYLREKGKIPKYEDTVEESVQEFEEIEDEEKIEG